MVIGLGIVLQRKQAIVARNIRYVGVKGKNYLPNAHCAEGKNIYHPGIKELRSLLRDQLLLGIIAYIFTVGIYSAATAMPDSLSHAVLAIVDEDDSQLSRRIGDAFLPPMFLTYPAISRAEIDPGMDRGDYTFVLVIPVNFQRDILAGRQPQIQLNVDATRMSQAFTGNNYIQQIVLTEISAFWNGSLDSYTMPVNIVMRSRFNPNLTQSWFGAVMELVNNITMLAIILTGAALIRERERGTLEHLLVMPVTSFEIMAAKVWSMTLVVLLATGFSLVLVIQDCFLRANACSAFAARKRRVGSSA